MIQVKEFRNNEFIHHDINRWLKKNKNKNKNIVIKEIKYSIGVNASGALVIYDIHDVNEDTNSDFYSPR